MKKLLKRWTVLLPFMASVFIILCVSFSQFVTAENVSGQLSLGNKYLSELQYDKAILEFTKAISVDRKNTDAYLGLADAYAGNGQSELAIALLKDFTDKYESDEILEKLVDIYIEDGKPEDANEIINSLIEKNDEDKYYDKQEELAKQIRARPRLAAFSRTHTVAVREGKLVALGSNAFGQFGSTERLGDYDYRAQAPVVLNFGGVVKTLAAGDGTTYVVDGSGDLWTAGLNLAAQQGNGSTIQNVSAFTKVPGIGAVAQVAAGATHALVLKEDGTVWGMGADTDGQLGLNAHLAELPTQIPGLLNIVAIRAAADYSLCLKGNGELYVMGVLPDSRQFTVPTLFEEHVLLADAANDFFAFTASDGRLCITGQNAMRFGPEITVNVVQNGVELMPSNGGYSCISAGGSSLAVLDSIGNVTLFSGSNATYQLAPSAEVLLGNDYCALIDSAGKLRLYSLANGNATEIL